MSYTDGTPTQNEALRAALARLERNLHTALPGRVVSYNSAKQTADVQPAIRNLLPSAENEDIDLAEDMPVLHSVPVCWPRGRGFSCVGTLSPGDPVLLVFCERDIGQWVDSGAVSSPQFTGLHELNGAVALPGLTPRSNPIPVPSDAAALASKLDALIAVLKTVLPGAASDTAAKILAKFPNVSGSTAPDPLTTTTGSSVLKLGG